MSLEPDPEIEDSDWERPVVLPVFQIPTRLAAGVAWGLVVSAALAIIAALVTAVSYRQAGPPGEVVAPGVRFSQPSIGFADRLSLFTNGAGNLTVALLVVIAVLVTGMAVRQGENRSGLTRRGVLLVATCAIGVLVLLANVAKAIVLLSNTMGQFSAYISDNKASNILALLPPSLSVAGALLYAASRLRNKPGPSNQGDPEPLLGTDT